MLGQHLENLHTRILVARVLAVVVCLSVCPSVTSRCFTEMAKRRITQTTPHYSPGTRVFFGAENLGKTQTESSPTERPNAGEVWCGSWKLATFDAKRCQLIAGSQVCHTERPRYLFAARSRWCSASRGFVSDSWSLCTHNVHSQCTILRHNLEQSVHPRLL